MLVSGHLSAAGGLNRPAHLERVRAWRRFAPRGPIPGPRRRRMAELTEGGRSSRIHTGLPGANATLGDVWASADGHGVRLGPLPVPGRHGSPAGIGLENRCEERTPCPIRAGNLDVLVRATLYRFDGTLWAVCPASIGRVRRGAVPRHRLPPICSLSTIGPRAKPILLQASTGRAVDPPRVMPELVLGRLHTLVGVPGVLYFRVDRQDPATTTAAPPPGEDLRGSGRGGPPRRRAAMGPTSVPNGLFRDGMRYLSLALRHGHVAARGVARHGFAFADVQGRVGHAGW
jgi:hypothetical protein